MIKIKVCGMRESDNLAALVELQPDFIGFIFYDKSPRFMGDSLDEVQLKAIPRSTKKVGVFVNANPDYILKTVRKYDLQLVQLHGSESPDFCKSLKNKGINIIKAFAIDEAFNFSSLNNFKPHCDFFLFDAKGQNPGGNGVAFDWKVLSNYDNEKPFFLSGGLSLENIEQAAALEGLKIYGFDINSKFELEPGLKDIDKIEQLLEIVRPVEEEIA
jgi:phosphoribosylanthranilate isomerase